MPEFVEDVTRPDEVEKVADVTKKITLSSDSDTVPNNYEDYIAKFVEISTNAQDNENREKNMSLKEGLKTFPKAAFWSVVLSTAIIMEGFDTNLLNSLYSLDMFAKKYGEYYPDIDQYQVPAKWQTSLSMSTNVGEIIGLYIAGLAGEKWGYRKTLMTFMTATIGLIFIVFFSVNIEMLLVGELLCGIVWGAFQTLTVSYASEVCPVVLRVYLTTYVNACWVIGQLISSGVLRGTLNMTTEWAYKIPWALQWMWPIPVLIGIYFAPESPWWLVKKGRTVEAKKSIMRLLSTSSEMPDAGPLADAMLNKMQLTIKEEDAIVSNISYMDCFKGSNWRRTRVASMIWVIQNITGSALMGYSTYFYKQAGLATSMSFTFSIIQYVLGLLGTLISWLLSQKFGRFDIFFGGLLANFCLLIVVGALGFHQNSSTSWAIGSLLLIFTFIYDATIGPITYCVVAELPSASVRSKTVGIARNMYNIAGIPVAIVTPYMLNPTAWNWKAKTGLFWAGLSFLSLIYVWFEFPETKGRTYAELDILFQQKVKAREFKNTHVEAFNPEEMLKKMDQDEIMQVVEGDEQAGVLSSKA
ncbi:General alpha-glucoside permease [Cyberlindnera fabianii]|uniref:General alpha-glucoside permease n=1 Tax=Cyberlindnera fabianii TaxID=36022 RepID=A0A1V2KZE1_CYBFA|nr:General alpha-glucoside permease [Cyberlindnera fabianii]